MKPKNFLFKIQHRKSIVVIKSQNLNDRSFGTGFIIHQSDGSTYILTCAHVVDDVGGKENVQIGKHKAHVEAIGKSEGLDLAVLSVKGLLDKSPMNLYLSDESGKSFTISGFYSHGKRIIRGEVTGKLGKETEVSFGSEGQLAKAWLANIVGPNLLQDGYSGSPVFDKDGVFGVVSDKSKQGEGGLVFSIQGLKQIGWDTIPFDLFNRTSASQDNILIRFIQVIILVLIAFGAFFVSVNADFIYPNFSNLKPTPQAPMVLNPEQAYPLSFNVSHQEYPDTEIRLYSFEVKKITTVKVRVDDYKTDGHLIIYTDKLERIGMDGWGKSYKAVTLTNLNPGIYFILVFTEQTTTTSEYIIDIIELN